MIVTLILMVCAICGVIYVKKTIDSKASIIYGIYASIIIILYVIALIKT